MRHRLSARELRLKRIEVLYRVVFENLPVLSREDFYWRFLLGPLFYICHLRKKNRFLGLIVCLSRRLPERSLDYRQSTSAPRLHCLVNWSLSPSSKSGVLGL